VTSTRDFTNSGFGRDAGGVAKVPQTPWRSLTTKPYLKGTRLVADFRDTPKSDKSSDFGSGLLLYAACAAVAAFVGWPIIKGGFPDSFPAESGGAARYDEYGYTGDPGRFDRWRNADRGGPREHSTYFPGTRTQQGRSDGLHGDYAMSPRAGETEMAQADDRQPESRRNRDRDRESRPITSREEADLRERLRKELREEMRQRMQRKEQGGR
jgi:hypothetical protein